MMNDGEPDWDLDDEDLIDEDEGRARGRGR
jgi:hypothetical protein